MNTGSISSATSTVSSPATPASEPRSDERSNAKIDTAVAGPIVPTAAPPERPAVIQPRPPINGEGLGMQFETDPATGTMVIRLVDTESGELVRQIPAEEVLHYLRQLETMKGKIFSRAL
jgi:flagellar protein FlaG